MHRIKPTPALLVAVLALVLAASGTALAAGELIIRSDQIAPDVIEGGHIATHTVGKTDIQHPTLRLRVRADGQLFGDPSDGTAQRISFGQYVVTFDRSVLDGPVPGPRNPRWLDDCAVVATPRLSGVGDGSRENTILSVMHTMTSAVVVVATEPDFELGRTVFADAPFEIAAIC